MGGAVTTGKNNDDLVDNLVEAGFIKSSLVEKVFRAVDRADYFLTEHRESAYKDLAWEHGHLHMSAPSVYSLVMESLQLKPGLSFLHLGSGTGYLNSMTGLVIGAYGENIGVELFEDVVEYAQLKQNDLTLKSNTFDVFDYCEPEIQVGNCLCLNLDSRLYDRVYCGAECPPKYENYMKNLISVGGILVMALNNELIQICRTGETTWETQNFLSMCMFASLIVPTEVPFLKELCRMLIRQILQTIIHKQHPHLNYIPKTQKKPKKKCRKKQANVVVVDQLKESDESDVEDKRRFESDKSHNDCEALDESETFDKAAFTHASMYTLTGESNRYPKLRYSCRPKFKTSGIGLSDDYQDSEMGKIASCCDQEHDNKVQGLSKQKLLRVMIDELPLPRPMQSYLMYYSNSSEW